MSIIRAVLARRNGAATLLDRAAQKRETAVREQLSDTLLRLHQIAVDGTPAPLRRLVHESEVERAAAVLRRRALAHPDADAATLLAHCERAAAEELDFRPHLVDPFQLRHVLTHFEDIPHEELTAVELYELERTAEHGAEESLLKWFRRVGARRATLPRGTTAFLRSLLRRHCAAGASRERMASLAFELAVLDVRMFGGVGWENTRLFCALLKQIGGEEVHGLESYLTTAEVAHAAARHRAAGDRTRSEHFRALTEMFDHSLLPQLERNVARAADANERAVPSFVQQPIPQTPARRNLLGALFGWANATGARG